MLGGGDVAAVPAAPELDLARRLVGSRAGRLDISACTYDVQDPSSVGPEYAVGIEGRAGLQHVRIGDLPGLLQAGDGVAGARRGRISLRRDNPGDARAGPPAQCGRA